MIYLVIILLALLCGALWFWGEAARVAELRGETIARLRDENAMLRRGLDGVMQAANPAQAAATRQLPGKNCRVRRAGGRRW